MANLEKIFGLTPLSEAERAPMQKVFVTGHLLPGINMSSENIRMVVDEIGGATGMNIFHGPTIKTPVDFDPETYRRLGGRPPEDVNVGWMWDDSGGSIYFFPDRDNWCVVDLHTCKAFDTQKVLNLLYSRLHFREDMQFAEQTHDSSSPWKPFLHKDGTLTPEKEYLVEFAAILAVDVADPIAVISAGRSLEKIVYQAIKEGWGDRLAAIFKPNLVKRLQDVYFACEIATDDLFMQAILRGEVPNPDKHPLQKQYDRLAEMEAEAAKIPTDRRVLHIGSGYPGTAIGLTKLGIPVTCVEIAPQRAEDIRSVLIKLGFGKDRITLVNADGCDLNPMGFSTVIISAMISLEDKMKIINNLRDLTVDGIHEPLVILREPLDRARALLYSQLPNGIRFNQDVILMDQTKPGADDPLKSLVCQAVLRAAIGQGSDVIILQALERLQSV